MTISDGIMSIMRTTLRIDDDLMIELEARAHAESVSLTRILNRTLRAGLARPKPDGARSRPFRQKTAAMGQPTAGLDKALALAARLEDEEAARKLSPRARGAGRGIVPCRSIGH